MADQNYTLGRGELHFARYKTGTQTPGGEHYFGNTPEFSMSISSENLDHFSSDRGIKEKDDSVLLSTDRTGSFTTDSIQPENIALFFFGTKEIVATIAAASQTQIIAPADVVQGYGYQLGTSAANPAGVNKVTGVVVKNTTTPATVYVLNTDYTLDADNGRVTLIEGGAIETGTGITIDFSIAATSRERIISGSQPIEGALRYIAKNPKGKQFSYFMPYVKLAPNGDFALKGDEWQTLPFTVEILKKTGLEAIYCDGVPYVPV